MYFVLAKVKPCTGFEPATIIKHCGLQSTSQYKRDVDGHGINETARRGGQLVETRIDYPYLCLWVEVRTSRIVVWLVRKVRLNHAVHHLGCGDLREVHRQWSQCRRLCSLGSPVACLRHVVLYGIHTLLVRNVVNWRMRENRLRLSVYLPLDTIGGRDFKNSVITRWQLGSRRLTRSFHLSIRGTTHLIQ